MIAFAAALILSTPCPPCPPAAKRPDAVVRVTPAARRSAPRVVHDTLRIERETIREIEHPCPPPCPPVHVVQKGGVSPWAFALGAVALGIIVASQDHDTHVAVRVGTPSKPPNDCPPPWRKPKK